MLNLDQYEVRLAALLARPMFSEDNIGFEFPPGWLHLVEQLVSDLEALPGGDALRAKQVKEKFGTLRFYLAGAGMRIDILGRGQGASLVPQEADTLLAAAQKLIRKAEGKSAHICELCGEPGETRPGGWVRTLCDLHADLQTDRARSFALYWPYTEACARVMARMPMGRNVNDGHGDIELVADFRRRELARAIAEDLGIDGPSAAQIGDWIAQHLEAWRRHWGTMP